MLGSLTAGAATVAGVGVATADEEASTRTFANGDCVVTTTDTTIYDDSACRTADNAIDSIPAGVDGDVQGECLSNFQIEFVLVDWGADPYEAGWVTAGSLDSC